MKISTACPSVALVVFDLAGTILDYGSRAPVLAFRAAFSARGVRVTDATASAPMGLDKRTHLRALLANPEVERDWVRVHGSPPSDHDVEKLYSSFVTFQHRAIELRSQLVPGAANLSRALRARGIRVATTTGYDADAAARALELARAQGFESDVDVCASDVRAARPAPDMIFLAMERVRVLDRARVIAVGDTIHDMAAAKNAGVEGIGVVRSSSLVGCTEEEWAELDEREQRGRLSIARRTLLGAGASELVDDLREMSDVLARRGSSRVAAMA